MPRDNTTATELCVGLGLLGLSPTTITEGQMQRSFDNTVSPEHFRRFKMEFENNRVNYEDFYHLGRDLQRAYAPFSNPIPIRAQWEGPLRQPNTSSVSSDLRVSGVSISVKDRSNVVRNPSPWNLFQNLPRGETNENRSLNWYQHIGVREYQELYSIARVVWWPELPNSVSEYDERRGGSVFWDRKALGKRIAGGLLNAAFQKRYVDFCRMVAFRSAHVFNLNLNTALAAGRRNSVVESILGFLFRLDVQEYVMCGIEGETRFAVIVPSFVEWTRHWDFLQLTVEPDLAAEQSVVNFAFHYQNKGTKQRFVKTFRAEVRWSHGKFCGNPEAKLYKGSRGDRWQWTDVEFYTPLVGPGAGLHL